MRRLFLLVIALSLAVRAASGAVCSPTTFISAPTYPAPNPWRIVAADFNDDGLSDVAATVGNSSSISVLLDNGDGTLGAPTTIPIGESVYGVVAADLRHNGTTDLVVAVYDGIAVLLGHGNGTFDAPVLYTANTYYPLAIVAGNFDADDSPDIVIASAYNQTFLLFPGNGDGTFAAPLDSPGAAIAGLTTGDFNHDGKLDLVASKVNAGTIAFFPGLGSGTFGPEADFIAGSQLGGITAADFDGNGDPDVAVTSGNFVSILLGNGDGTFQAAFQYIVGVAPQAIVTADFNLDGIPDLAVNDYQTQAVTVLAGIGDGSFGPPQPYLVGWGIAGLAVGDLDGDGSFDLVSSNGDSNTVSVLINDGTGSLLAVPETTPVVGPYAFGSAPTVARGDWNGDGREDFAWSNYDHIAVLESTGDGRFAPWNSLSGGESNPQIYAVVNGDFDGDGMQDLAATTYSDLLVYHGNGDGTFGPGQSVLSSYSLGALAAGDFNGDGKPDLAVTQACCGSQVLLTLLGNGDGTFQLPVQTSTTLDLGFLRPADFNGDGSADLAAVSSSAVLLFVSEGDGTFQAPVAVTQQNGCCFGYSIATGRFGGAALDLLISSGDSNVALYPGNGDGTFGAPTFIGLPASSGPVTAGDYDGDANADFAVIGSPQTIVVFPGLGNRHFQTPVTYLSASQVSTLQSGNFTGSGRTDIASISPIAITTLVNSGLAATAPPAVSALVGSPASVTARASGFGPVTYQWRRDGAPISDGGPISGATTATLVIDPANFTDAGSYDVVVTDACTNAVSNAVTLAVEFADVPLSNIFHADILTIATAGVTAGCGGADYCPSTLVTRAQMAVFLLKSEHGSAYVPPHCAGIFTDVPCPSAFADWIEQLSNEGVTAGCGGGNYCPDSSITRAQMAVFLLKTSLGSGYVPPAATAIFGDVPVDAFAAEWIDDLYNRGIAGGCSVSPLLYCPDSPVNRAQMAAFLVNTFFGP